MLCFFLRLIAEVNSIKHSSSKVALGTIRCEVLFFLLLIYLFNFFGPVKVGRKTSFQSNWNEMKPFVIFKRINFHLRWICAFLIKSSIQNRSPLSKALNNRNLTYVFYFAQSLQGLMQILG